MHDDYEVSEDEYICILSTFVFLCRLQVGIIKRVSLRICFHLRFPIHRPKIHFLFLRAKATRDALKTRAVRILGSRHCGGIKSLGYFFLT